MNRSVRHDEEYYGLFNELVTRSKVVKLHAPKNREELKKEWMEKGSLSDIFRYNSFIPSVYDKKRESLEALKGIFDKNSLIGEMYRSLCDIRISKIDAGIAMRSSNDERLKQSFDFQYGVLDQKVASIVAEYNKTFLSKKNLISRLDDQEIKDAYDSVSQVFSGCNGTDTLTEILEEQAGDKPTGKQVGSEYALGLIEKSLRSIHAFEWRAVIEPYSTSWIRVNQSKKIIIIPSGFTASEERLESLILHEVHVHVRRSIQAQQGLLGILEFGLPWYLKGEEGVAKYLELFEAHHRKRGTFIDLATGILYVHGLFDGEQHNLLETLGFYENLWICQNPRRFQEKGRAVARVWAWSRAQRIFRATTGMTKGVCNTKDFLYVQGFLDVYNSTLTHPQESKRWFCGKYDPSNEMHRTILDKYNIH